MGDSRLIRKRIVLFGWIINIDITWYRVSKAKLSSLFGICGDSPEIERSAIKWERKDQ